MKKSQRKGNGAKMTKRRKNENPKCMIDSLHDWLT